MQCDMYIECSMVSVQVQNQYLQYMHIRGTEFQAIHVLLSSYVNCVCDSLQETYVKMEALRQTNQHGELRHMSCYI